jgi:hypothetical protein
MDINIINKNIPKLIGVVFENFHHCPKNYVCCVFQSKQHHTPPKKTKFGNDSNIFISYFSIIICDIPNYKPNVENHVKFSSWVNTWSMNNIGK